MELQIFQNAEFGSVRSVTVNGEPHFVGKDVAEILGYSNTRKALLDHVDEDDKMDGVTIRDSIGRDQTPVFINESGLYSLILSSKLPTAKRFKRWVTSEVLPAIRRHGLYAVDDMLNNPDALIEALQAYKAERMQRMALEAANAKVMADKNPGYEVYDWNGKLVYPEVTDDAASGMTNADCPFMVKVSIEDLNIRKGAGTNTAKTGQYTGIGVFTIVEVREGKGSDTGWGKLKSGAGWIALSYCERV